MQWEPGSPRPRVFSIIAFSRFWKCAVFTEFFSSYVSLNRPPCTCGYVVLGLSLRLGFALVWRSAYTLAVSWHLSLLVENHQLSRKAPIFSCLYTFNTLIPKLTLTVKNNTNKHNSKTWNKCRRMKKIHTCSHVHSHIHTHAVTLTHTPSHADSSGQRTDGDLCPALRSVISPWESAFTTKQITGSCAGCAVRIPTIPTLVFRSFPSSADLTLRPPSASCRLGQIWPEVFDTKHCHRVLFVCPVFA